MAFALLAAALGLATQDYSGPWHLEYAPAHHVRVTWAMTRECPESTVRGWEVYGPVPPSLDYQKMQGSPQVAISFGDDGNPMESMTPQSFRDASLAQVPIWGIQFLPSSGTLNRRLRVASEYDVTTYSRRLVPGKGANPPAPLSQNERGLYLKATKEFDTGSKEFQKYLDDSDLRRHAGETVLAFAHRVYRFVRQGMKYKVDAPFETTLTEDCKTPWGHCGNYSRRIVGIMRANAIPARMSFGHWIVGGTNTYPEGRPHTRSEIYVDDIGWVLLDTSEGIPDGGWKPEPNLDCGFAEDDGGFFVFHLNSSLIVPTKTWGPQPQMHLQNIYMPALGGSWDGSTTTYSFTVEELPINK